VPTYEYVCVDCGEHVEVHQSFQDEPLTTCTNCGGKLRKVYHPIGVMFRGSGFYSTDHRSGATGSARRGEVKEAKEAKQAKESKDGAKAERSESSSSDGGTSSGKSSDSHGKASDRKSSDRSPDGKSSRRGPSRSESKAPERSR
jgi:putative FmdB family regulatory protein